jgi:SAM-dependent methyltransferase
VGEARHCYDGEGLLSRFEAFAREHVPPLTEPGPPPRLLEVGCGRGELTTALALSGYDVLGIDPAAPEGHLFRRLRLEDLDEPGPYDGVLAGSSLHHIRDLGAALDKIARLLAPKGVLVVEEFAWDRLDEPTLAWFAEQRRARSGGGGEESVDALRGEWEADHLGLHGEEALLRGLAERFAEQAFEWTPYLYRLLGDGATEVLERALVDSGEIQALGFRYVGRPRSAA